MKVAVLIPCYNEELTVGDTVTAFRLALPDADIYVYDNNSTDNTASVASACGAIVRKAPKQGKGAVVRQMFQEIDADVYLMTDGDNTYPAEDAGKLIAELDHCDMSIGDRLSDSYSVCCDRAFHGAGNKLVRWLVNVLYHGDISDIMTGYRAFTRDFVKSIEIKSDGFEVETELSILALKQHRIIRSMPVRYRERPAGSVSKLHTVSDGIKVILTVFLMKFRSARRDIPVGRRKDPDNGC